MFPVRACRPKERGITITSTKPKDDDLLTIQFRRLSRFPLQNDTPTPDRPLFVTPSQIELFERLNPSLAGIGEVMVDMKLWVLVGSESH
ncbi:MAG: hypothetical protein PHH09_12555 [Methanoregulaceae archaeon]|nr:hypothetical protein [Methanoregulaceae archaeon]